VEINNKLLTFAVQCTTTFEQLLTKRFLGRSIPKPAHLADVSDEDWKPFIGIISQCFDAHFDIYANFTDQWELFLFFVHVKLSFKFFLIEHWLI
jgi:hypothetical protein